MKARIEILTRTLQRTSRFCAVGVLDRMPDGVTVTYPIEEDVSVLELRKSGAILKRRGENQFDAEFIVGGSTFFRISLQGSNAELPVFTTAYKNFFSDSEILSRLTYDLGMGPTSQNFSLKIKIQILSEEQ